MFPRLMPSSIHPNPVFPQQLRQFVEDLAYTHISPGLAIFFMFLGESE